MSGEPTATDTLQALPTREGPRPRTRMDELPHSQLDQLPKDRTVNDALSRMLFALPDVEERPSGISVPGARALCVREGVPLGPPEAFFVDREFAHLHPLPDQSLHLTLPTAEAELAISAGWAEWHPYTISGKLPPTVVMVYAPRDDVELETVTHLVRRSWRFARGTCNR